MSKGKMRQLETIKTKIFGKKTHLLLRILAVISRYGPHLMIVMIFVTQNNLKWPRNFWPSLWILPKPRFPMCVYACKKITYAGQKSWSPCQSLVDYGNSKITRHVLNVSEPSEGQSWTIYGRRTVIFQPVQTILISAKQHQGLECATYCRAALSQLCLKNACLQLALLRVKLLMRLVVLWLLFQQGPMSLLDLWCWRTSGGIASTNWDSL